MLMVDFSITPLGKGESVAEPVARALEIIDRSGLKYQLGPMSTSIEGEWDQVMKVIHDCVEALHQKDSDRVYFSIRGDYQSGAQSRLKEKVTRVEEVLGRHLQS